MSGKQKKILVRIISAAILLIAAYTADKTVQSVGFRSVVPLMYLVPYFVIGYDVLCKAAKNIFNGRLFDENFLMTIATVGAMCIGLFPNAEPEYAEAVFVMLFYQTGELFQSIAVGKSRRSISKLMEIRPDTAFIMVDGETVEIDPEELKVGDIITVRPGDRIPTDGRVIEGSSAVNTVALTGEALPREVAPGDGVISGCVNMSGVLTVEVTKVFAESTVSRILELVENSSENKSRSENFITKFARVYTPIIVCAAAALAFLPPLFSAETYLQAFPKWLIRALSFLVISCPCALVISVPLSFFGGIGGTSKRGVLVKGSNYLEALAKTDTVVFDKTGTLTKGAFEVTEIHAHGISDGELLRLAASAECFSNHPIATALNKAFDGEIDRLKVEDVTETAGHGVTATVGKSRVSCGNGKLMNALGLSAESYDGNGTVVHVAIDGEYKGFMVISDSIKENAVSGLAALKQNGVRRLCMLTGDRKSTAAGVAEALGNIEYRAELLPEDKVAEVGKLIAEMPDGGKLAFVGDGINDAPVLMRADIGIAMGALGSDAAIEAADIVLMDDDPGKIAPAIKIARRTLKIVHENIAFALSVKAAVLILSIFGLAPMWAAVFADVGVAVIAILNAMRTLN